MVHLPIRLSVPWTVAPANRYLNCWCYRRLHTRQWACMGSTSSILIETEGMSIHPKVWAVLSMHPAAIKSWVSTDKVYDWRQMRNKIARERDFTIVNCKAPTPLLSGWRSHWSDANGQRWRRQGRYRNDMCLCQRMLIKEVTIHVATESYWVFQDTTVKSRCFGCSDLGQQNVTPWVTDAITGLQSSCKYICRNSRQ